MLYKAGVSTLPVQQFFEGTPGAAFTQATSSGGGSTALDVAVVDPSAILKFSAAAAHTGSTGLEATQIASPTASTYARYSGWNTTASIWFRAYFRVDSTSSGNFMFAVRNAGDTTIGYWGISATGLMTFQAQGTTNAALTGTVAVVPNQWYRVEVRMAYATGDYDWWMWTGADLESNDVTRTVEVLGGSTNKTSTGNNFGTGPSIDGLRFSPVGVTTGFLGAGITGRIDDLAVSTTGRIGPRAITQRTARVTETAGAQTLTGALPVDVTTGDYVLAFYSGTGTPSSMTEPSAPWVRLTNLSSIASTEVSAVYGAFNTAGTLAAPVMATTTAAGRSTWIVQAFGGVDVTTPVDSPTTPMAWAQGGAASSAGVAYTTVIPAITTLSGNALLLSFYGGDYSAATSSYALPPSMTQMAQFTPGTGRAAVAAFEALSAAGSTGTRTWTTTASANGLVSNAVMLALRLAGSSSAPTNTAEGGVPGATVTTANSGGPSGTAWPVVTHGTAPSVIRYTSDSAHGGVAYEFAMGSTLTAMDLDWDSTVTTAGATWSGRVYVKIPVNQAAGMNFLRVRGGGTLAAGIGLNASGNLTIYAGTNGSTLQATSANAVPVGKWFRVEWTVVASSGTTGSIDASFWSGVNVESSAAPVAGNTVSATGIATNTVTTLDTLQLGTFTAGIPNSSIFFDDVALVYSATKPGPVTTTQRVVSNTAEGGPSGATVSAVNSGALSGDPFDSVVVGTGGLTFDSSTAAHGGVSIRMTQGAVASANWLVWDAAMGAVSEIYGRVAYNTGTAYPGGSQRIVRFLNGASIACAISFTSSGKFRFVSGTGGDTDVTTPAMAATVPLNTWVRLEFRVLFSASVGTADLWYYADPSTTTLTEQLSFSGQNTGGQAQATICRIGQIGGQALNESDWFDDLGLASAKLGPLVVPVVSGAGTTGLFDVELHPLGAF